MEKPNVQIRKAIKQMTGKDTQMGILRVAAYVRVSTDDKEQLESYQSQMKYYKELIAGKPEWQMVGIYADEAISGTKTAKRNEFNRMINDCMNGEIDLVLVKSISRFARNTVDTLQYVRQLKERKIAVVFEEENINTLSMEGELLLTILSSVAQQEVQNISEHVKMGLAMKMQRGEMVGFNGCLGYDYNKEEKTITINNQEAEAVRYIFQRYVEGAGGKVIARELNNLGYKNKQGKSNFTDRGVISVIKNEKYKGDLLMGKTFTLDPISKRRLKNFGEADQYYIEAHHEPIVSKEMFEQAQRILHRRKNSHIRKGVNGKREKFSRQFAFSCMLKCGFCGGNLTRRTWNSRNNYKKTIWQCVTATKNGKKGCPHCKGVPEKLLEEAFVKSYNNFCKYDEKIIDSFLDRVKSNLIDNDNIKEIKIVENDIFKIKERKGKLVDLLLDKKIDEKTFQNKVNEIDEKLEKLSKRENQLKDLQREEKDINQRLLEFRNILSNKEILKEFDRFVFESIIDKVIVGEIKANGEIDPYKIKFIYKTGNEDEEIVNVKQFSNGKLSSNTHDNCDIMLQQGEQHTCGDGNTASKNCGLNSWNFREGNEESPEEARAEKPEFRRNSTTAREPRKKN